MQRNVHKWGRLNADGDLEGKKKQVGSRRSWENNFKINKKYIENA
jgi:hypothetical protein